MVRKAKGKRPVYLEHPQTDRVLAMVMALVGEVAVLRERLDTLERLAEAKGLLSAEEVENYRPDDYVAKERERWRAEYLDRVLRVLREELEEVEEGGVPKSYEEVVRLVSS